jgi:hypothetical protein
MIDNPWGPRARGLEIQAIVDKAPTISLHGNASRYMYTCDYTQETVRISFVRCLEADRQAGGGRRSLLDLDTSFLFPCGFEPWLYFHRLPPNQKHTDDDLECVSQAEELLTKKYQALGSGKSKVCSYPSTQVPTLLCILRSLPSLVRFPWQCRI